MRVIVRTMKFIRPLLIAFTILLQFSVTAIASERYGWMDAQMDTLKGFFGCVEVPVFAGMQNAKHSLDLDNSGNWVSTGVKVQDGKLLQIEWLANGVLPRPAKYRVLYRIDPRFAVPQIFIQKFDFSTKKYLSDFHRFKNGQLLRYQDIAEMTFQQRIIDYNEYFNFNGRQKIPVKKDDVINITMDTTGKFFSSDSEMHSELFGIGSELLSIYTSTSSLPDNHILYSNLPQFCESVINGTGVFNEFFQNVCKQRLDIDSSWNSYIGKMDDNIITLTKWQQVPNCPDSANGKDNRFLCKYNLGRGMILSIGGTEIKNERQKFVYSAFTGKNFFYHKSNITGALEFKSPWSIDRMYNTDTQFMSKWPSLQSVNDYFSFYAYMTIIRSSLNMNFIYMGRYLMDIEIGNSSKVITPEDLKDIKIEYYISDTTIPDSTTSGTTIGESFRGNAYEDGFLWLRVINPNPNITGTIQVKTANYTGTNWFSNVVYDNIIKPLREKFNELSEVIYKKLISNAALQNIARLMLVLYIIMYGLMFLAGATQITVTDIVIRVLKIGVVLALFSETSWTFFSNNLFNVFIDGTEYLMTTVIGVTSSAGNVFGFIDPVIEKYINGNMWALLSIQLLQIHNGLTFFAFMTIYGILIFFRAVLQVIVGYCLAFLGLAVMISLAPFFIILILFERTKGMFDSWISTMFSQMIQPTIMLIFFLLIDQIMGEFVTRTVVRACWDILIPIKIGLDLNHMSIPISFSFTLPFLPGIPFYVPEVRGIGSMTDFFFAPGTFSMIATSTFIFFALCKLADGLIDYVTLVVQYLTNVLAARQDGKLQRGMTPIKDITSDMEKLASPITGAAKSVGNFAKEKLIDQKISRRATKSDVGNIDYDSEKRSAPEDFPDTKDSPSVNKKDPDNKKGPDTKKTEAQKKDDSGGKTSSSGFGSKKPANAGKDNFNKLRYDDSNSLAPKDASKQDAKGKRSSVGEESFTNSGEKNTTGSAKVAQPNDAKNREVTDKEETNRSNTDSLAGNEPMAMSEARNAQRREFTQNQQIRDKVDDTSRGEDIDTSTKDKADDNSSASPDRQTRKDDLPVDSNSNQKPKVDSDSKKPNTQEQIEPRGKEKDTHTNNLGKDKKLSRGNKPTTERRQNKKFTRKDD